MGPRLILFDVDGTLIDTAGAGRRAMIRAFHDVFQVDGVERGAGRIPFAGMTDLQIFRSLAGATRVAADRLEASMERLEETYTEALRAEMGLQDQRRRVLPGVRPLLEQLDTWDDVFLGLLTGNLEAGARIKLGPFGLNRFFPGGGFGSDGPDRRAVARVAHQQLCRVTGIGFEPSNVVVVGDTESDVDCAQANGFRAVAVGSGWSSREALERAGPHIVLNDLSDWDQTLQALGIS